MSRHCAHLRRTLLARKTVEGARCILAPASASQAKDRGSYWSTCAPYPYVHRSASSADSHSVSSYASSADGIAAGKDMLRELLDMLAPVDARVKSVLSL